MSTEKLARAGQEGGPLTLLPQPGFLWHLSQAHTGAFVPLSLWHCVCSSPRWVSVAWAQMSFMDGQCWGRQPLLGQDHPQNSEFRLTLELLPYWQCRHPGSLVTTGFVSGIPPPIMNVIPGEGSHIWKARVPQ
jgi:hypothetical protein